ncbi:ribonuclease H [Salpingoeca rosetta]|uniref:Ribonuclease H n=1 Tax=Salpingoeca rosetta (strain ATCC 50818 / BSB-021) TaxID=946362 RepID=F2UNN2_SALR5|nr:ribonuclease H [Salpingoeca rosetta]EGD79237.1 ribonuclease H [Salpingoeca rosetta]|eukprot:XP_004989322.1 ribonuclease H [Salpingoeca rosetta]
MKAWTTATHCKSCTCSMCMRIIAQTLQRRGYSAAASRIRTATTDTTTTSSSSSMAYFLNFDGGARAVGRSKLAGCGCALYNRNGVLLERHWKSLPNGSTCNEAEYEGLRLGLARCRHLGIADVIVRGDSKLIINQVFGKWRVKAKNLQPYHALVKQDVRAIGKISGCWVPRAENEEADALANKAMRMRSSGADILVRVQQQQQQGQQQQPQEGEHKEQEVSQGEPPARSAPSGKRNAYAADSEEEDEEEEEEEEEEEDGLAGPVSRSEQVAKRAKEERISDAHNPASRAGSNGSRNGSHVHRATVTATTPQQQMRQQHQMAIPASSRLTSTAEVHALFDPLIEDAERYLSTLYARRDAALERIQHQS